MMRYFLSLFILSLFCSHSSLQAQSFEKGDMNLDLGLGFGIYSTTVSFTFDFFGEPVTVTEEDGAASFMVPISFEYGISEKVGIGAEVAFSNYYIDEEDTTAVSETVKGIDYALFVNYHLSSTEKNDLMVGLLFGGSSINWQFEDGNDMTGSGGRFSLYLKDRLYLSKQVGILFELGYNSYSYNKISASNDNAVLEKLDWKLGGVHVGTGLTVKF